MPSRKLKRHLGTVCTPLLSISARLVLDYQVERNTTCVARPFALSQICKSYVGLRSGVRASALSIGTSMLLDPVTRTGSGSAEPAPQAATLLNYAEICRSGPAKPSADVFGQVRSHAGLRIEEVNLERTRFFRKYRSHLDNALGFLVALGFWDDVGHHWVGQGSGKRQPAFLRVHPMAAVFWTPYFAGEAICARSANCAPRTSRPLGTSLGLHQELAA